MIKNDICYPLLRQAVSKTRKAYRRPLIRCLPILLGLLSLARRLRRTLLQALVKIYIMLHLYSYPLWSRLHSMVQLRFHHLGHCFCTSLNKALCDSQSLQHSSSLRSAFGWSTSHPSVNTFEAAVQPLPITKLSIFQDIRSAFPHF